MTPTDERRDARPRGPEVPDDVTGRQLDREARSHLRGLAKDNAEVVARHLVMAGRLLDENPELAYEHAQAAVRRGGRIDVVREAAGLTAYRLGRYAEALRELRTVRRLNGSSEHLAVMADCERGLGRPERAIELSQSAEAATLDRAARLELALVVSGARLDLGQVEAAAAVLDGVDRRRTTDAELRRLDEARVTVLAAAGDEAGADALRQRLDDMTGDDELLVVFDLEDDLGADESGSDADSAGADDTPTAERARDDSVAGAVGAERGEGVEQEKAADELHEGPGASEAGSPATAGELEDVRPDDERVGHDRAVRARSDAGREVEPSLEERHGDQEGGA